MSPLIVARDNEPLVSVSSRTSNFNTVIYIFYFSHCLMNNSFKETIRIICSLSMMHVSTTVQQNTSNDLLYDVYDWFPLELFPFLVN